MKKKKKKSHNTPKNPAHEQQKISLNWSPEREKRKESKLTHVV